MRNAQLRNRHTRIDRQTDLGQKLFGAPVQCRSVHDAETFRQAFQHQVFGNGKMRQQVEFLMNDADPLNLRVMRGLWLVGPAVQKNFACVGLIYASKKLDESRFTRTVFTQNDMRLATLQLQRDTV